MHPRATTTYAGLHFSFQSDTVLFSTLQVSSWPEFCLAAALTCCICLSERAVTLTLKAKYAPALWKRESSALKITLWRTVLYAMATTLQLSYMLIAMTLHVGLLLVIVTTLSLCQLYIEYREAYGTSGSLMNPTRAKASEYSPISQHPLGDHNFLAPYHHNPNNSSYDLEMSQSPRSTASCTWDDNREARDKARQIMSGVTTFPTSASEPASRPGSQPNLQDAAAAHRNGTSPVHRRQSSVASNDPLKKTNSYLNQYSRRSGSSLQGLSHGGRRGPASRGGSTPTGNGNNGRRLVFQIGTSGEDRSSDTD